LVFGVRDSLDSISRLFEMYKIPINNLNSIYLLKSIPDLKN
jgi:hypothetical protein